MAARIKQAFLSSRSVVTNRRTEKRAFCLPFYFSINGSTRDPGDNGDHMRRLDPEMDVFRYEAGSYPADDFSNKQQSANVNFRNSAMMRCTQRQSRFSPGIVPSCCNMQTTTKRIAMINDSMLSLSLNSISVPQSSPRTRSARLC